MLTLQVMEVRMAKDMYRVYLNNEPWICDPENEVFVKDSRVELPFDLVDEERRHVASLQVVLIKGYPYYHDERLREFRRVGGPHIALTYEQFDLLDEKDQRLTIPTDEAFKKAMEKEAAFWKREAVRHADSDRGGA